MPPDKSRANADATTNASTPIKPIRRWFRSRKDFSMKPRKGLPTGHLLEDELQEVIEALEPLGRATRAARPGRAPRPDVRARPWSRAELHPRSTRERLPAVRAGLAGAAHGLALPVLE